jgi:hypothetical protein
VFKGMCLGVLLSVSLLFALENHTVTSYRVISGPVSTSRFLPAEEINLESVKNMCSDLVFLQNIRVVDSQKFVGTDPSTRWNIVVSVRPDIQTIKFSTYLTINNPHTDCDILSSCNQMNVHKIIAKFSYLRASPNVAISCYWIAYDFYYTYGLNTKVFAHNYARYIECAQTGYSEFGLR